MNVSERRVITKWEIHIKLGEEEEVQGKGGDKKKKREGRR